MQLEIEYSDSVLLKTTFSYICYN